MAEGYSAPASFAEAKQEQQKLISEIKDIQFKLGDRDMTDHTGRRLGGVEYFQWRKKALYAVKIRERRLAILKTWLREHPNNEEAISQALHQVFFAAQKHLQTIELRDRQGYTESIIALNSAVKSTEQAFAQGRNGA